MLKKIIAIALVIVLTTAIAVGVTVAYLTDRDSEANVFSVGNVSIDLKEDFQQGTTLIPGVNIEKKPTITNTGLNEAWVWLEFAIPSALDNAVNGTDQGSDLNTIHWNPKGATTENYVTAERVENAIAEGFFEGFDTAILTADYINSNKMHWNVFNSLGEGKNFYQTKINDIDYNVYVLLYNKALAPKETTLPNIYNVYMDARVDIDPNGDWYRIVNGNATKIDWNSNTNGSPVIYVSAYAVQKEGFESVNAAYAAYQNQWGDKSSSFAAATGHVTAFNSNGELEIQNDGSITIATISNFEGSSNGLFYAYINANAPVEFNKDAATFIKQTSPTGPWTDPAAIAWDGDNFMTLAMTLNAEAVNKFISENRDPAVTYQFDWDGNGTYDQTVKFVVDADSVIIQ